MDLREAQRETEKRPEPKSENEKSSKNECSSPGELFSGSVNVARGLYITLRQNYVPKHCESNDSTRLIIAPNAHPYS